MSAPVGARGEAPHPRTEPRGGPESLLVAGAHLAVLSGFALAQPLFELLADNPEFLAARGSTSAEIVFFAVCLTLVPPALLLLVEALLGLLDPRLRAGAHLVFAALLSALVAIQALEKATELSSPLLVVLALLMGAALAGAYALLRPIASFLTVLTPAPLVFLALFLFVSPVSKLTLASEAKADPSVPRSQTPVVMVVFDELPLISLLDARGGIDADRYPNFAALARDSTWFRNTTAIHGSTSMAIPAILDGKHPSEDRRLPTASQHPNSLFTLLGRSHRLIVREEATSLCPRRLCHDERLDEPFLRRIESLGSDLGLAYLHVIAPPAVERHLASVSDTWGDFGADDGGARTLPRARAQYCIPGKTCLKRGRPKRPKRFTDSLTSIRAGRRPELHFFHMLLPHVPWQYLPSGKRYADAGGETIPGLFRSPVQRFRPVAHAYQRHLLQLGFTDRELGRLLRRLRATGLYDKALVVVMADHGISFRRGQADRRTVTAANIEDIAPVPLFVKAPGQRRGRRSEALVRTTDVVPTIADLLNVRLPWQADGGSAFGEVVRRRRMVRMLTRSLDWLEIDAASFARRKRDALERKISLFGSGRDSPGIYGIGPHPELLGRRVDTLPIGGPASATAEIDGADALRSVDLGSGFLPTHVTGRVAGDPAGTVRDIAIAVNGRIAAVTTGFYFEGIDTQYFSAMVPESELRAGANEVEVFAVAPGKGAPILQPLGRIL